MTKAIQAGQ